MHRSQILSLSISGYLVGVWLFSLAQRPLWYAWVLLGAAILALWLEWSVRAVRIGALIAATAAIGMLHVGNFIEHQTALQRLVGYSERFFFDGYVAGEISRLPTYSSAPYMVQGIQAPGEPWRCLNEKALAYLPRGASVEVGDRVGMQGVLRQPGVSPEFNQSRYLLGQGMRVIISKVAVEGSSLSPCGGRSISAVARGALWSIRARMEQAISVILPSPSAGYVQGILLGSRSALPKRLRDDFAIAGVTHVLAVSGFNISIVAMAFLAGAIYMFQRRPAALMALAGIWCFTLLVGAPASAVRAASMGSVLLVAQIVGRRYAAGTALLAAAGAMVALNPPILAYDIGFQLSCAAVAGLLIFAPFFSRWLGRVGSFWGDVLGATVSAQIAVLPLVLWHFGRLSPYAILANILIVPFVPLTMALGAGGGVLGAFFPGFAGVFGAPAWAIASYQLSVVRLIAHLPGAGVAVPIGGAAAIGIYILGGCAIAGGLYVLRKRGVKSPENHQ